MADLVRILPPRVGADDPVGQVDVVIVGGGLVGISLALALEQGTGQSLKVMLVEAFPPPRKETGDQDFAARTTALSHSSKVIYEKLGVWQGLRSMSAAIETIHVSEKGRWGATRLSAAEQSLDDFGYVATNEVIGQSLLEALSGAQQVTLETPAEVRQISRLTEGYRLTIERAGSPQKRTEVTTRLLVIADGGRSSLMQQAGIEQLRQDYEQCAIVTNLIVSRPHKHIAYERFTSTGAMALLPLPDFAGQSQYSLVWTVPGDQKDSLLALPEVHFLDLLQQQIGYRCGKLLRAGSRSYYPLALTQAKEQVRDGLVILGNAAHTLHPVAGQGYNLSLRDAMVLAELINHVTTKDELSSAELGRQYLERQQADQARVIKSSDALIKLFGSSSAQLRQGRQLGLIALNLLIPAKHQFAEFAMGVGGVAADWRS